MNKYKKRLIKRWKDFGVLTMMYLEKYRDGAGDSPLHYTGDLRNACHFYIEYFNVYLLLNEHNI